jgi:DNA-binding NarL/FixJ family response regulator
MGRYILSRILFYLPPPEYVSILLYIEGTCIMINIALFTQYNKDRLTISSLLAEQEDFRITDIGTDAYDALKSVMKFQTDIIIMDFILQGINSLDLAPAIKRISPSSSIIVLCSCEEQDAVVRAFSVGISGCLQKQGGYADLVSSVRSVYYGGLYVSEISRNYALNFLFKTEKDEFQDGFSISRTLLTVTEICIFNEIILGFTDKEIAKSLHMSIHSLRNCVSRVKHKTGLHNRTQITIYALLSGIVKLPAPNSDPSEINAKKYE